MKQHEQEVTGDEPGDSTVERRETRAEGAHVAAGGRLSRRQLLAGASLATGAALMSSCAPDDGAGGEATSAESSAETAFELEEVTLEALQKGMADGRWTARSITQAYLDRIEALDRRGPELRSVLEVNPEALDIAGALDRERQESGARGPLHGVPILLKDNIATADQMTTTAGSLALEGSIPTEDSFVAAQLRRAGAVLLGKANLSEWANFRSENSSSGWSGRGGQCRNPYALDRNPCGSSSGSGAAASGNLCAVAIGTETNGSIVCPSSANGLVGIKPTVGLVSRSRIIPISHTQDTAGPMARTVRDAALVLGALAGVDEADEATQHASEKGHTDYEQFLDASGLEGARIGVARDYLGFDSRVDGLIDGALEAMRQAGAEIIDPVSIATRSSMGSPSYQVLLYEFKADLNAYLGDLGGAAPVRSLEELIAWNEAHADREMPYFGQDILVLSQGKGDLSSDEYQEALAAAARLSRDEGIDATMDEHKLDAIVAATGGPAWTTDLVNGDHFSGGSSSPAAIAGYPNVSLPMGYIFGLPVGISFFGRAWSEPVLIRLAYAYEQLSQHRQPPRFLPTAQL